MEHAPRAILEIENLHKNFGKTQVLKGISITVNSGEFVTLLGPSGCGKTTTLRIIAGLETPDAGRLLLNGEDITAMPPEHRKVNTVFQNYALFPHMDVYNNVAYGLKIRKKDKDTVNAKVSEVLNHVQMAGYEKRRPDQLSGGQRQRIAIARALVNEPEILLLDEPLGALDLKLRQHMQAELKTMQRELGITFIYVTHDQEEALNMSDRLVVMDGGLIMQTGTPQEIYNRPRNRFVADFVGERNILKGTLKNMKGDTAYITYCNSTVAARWPEHCRIPLGSPVTAAVHTDRITVSHTPPDSFCITGVVTAKHFSGSRTKLDITLENGDNFRKIEYNKDLPYQEGQQVYLSWEMENCAVVADNPPIEEAVK